MTRNPAAFPRPWSKDDYGGCHVEVKAQEGMTLRDWFAGQALQSIANPVVRRDFGLSWKQVATMAYEAADAMLAEREKEVHS